MDKNINNENLTSIFHQIQNNINNPKSEDNFQKIKINKKNEKIGDYILEETLGEDSFSKVKLAYHFPTKEKVAIKIINKEKIDINKISNEIKILKRIKHINIIQIYEVIETNEYLYIIMEYCENKDLYSLIKSKHNLSEIEACKYFQQIINGVENIHLSNITHRNLKPENILLTDNKERIVIKGFISSILSEEYNSELNTLCGSLSYSPPEILKGNKYNGLYSDIWSCGIILYALLVGVLPYSENDRETIYNNIITHNIYYPENLSSDAIDLIEHLLKVNPNERYNFDEIKAHPWFNLINIKLLPSIQLNIQKIPIDSKILEKAKDMGYDIQKMEESVIKSKYDSFNATYYLILKQFKRKGINSVSDLYSQDFINYFKNYKNWIDVSKINDPLYKDYVIELPNDLKQSNDNSNYISVNKSQKLEDIEEKNYEKYINEDKMINDMEIKFDNINIFDSFDDLSEIRDNKYIKNNRNKKIKNLKELVGMISTDNEEFSTRKRETEFSKSNNNHSNNNIFIRVNKKNKEKNILLNEELSQNNKEKIISKLKEEETKFNEELNIIRKYQNKNNSYDNNIIRIIAEKLIKTTIFSKYLIHNKKSKTFLENKFYILQKYKNIIGLIERMRNKIFTKKLNDFNIYTFNEYLNDENDKLFTKYLINIPYFNKFIQQAKDTFYKSDLLDRKTFSKYYEKNYKNDNNGFNNRLYNSYSNNFFGRNIHKRNNQVIHRNMAFTPNRNIKYVNLDIRYTNTINKYENINYKNTPYKYKNLLKTPKTSRSLHKYKSRNKYKTYKSAGKFKQIYNNNPINRPFNTMRKKENKDKEYNSSYSNDSLNKYDKKQLINDSENCYINTDIYSSTSRSNRYTIKNKSNNITSKKINKNIYNSPKLYYNKTFAISPYKNTNKKISVQLLSDRKEKDDVIKTEYNNNYYLKELKEFTPINLNCIIINISPNKIISKIKKFLMKKGYFCSNKINEYIIKAIKGGSHIDIILYKLKYLKGNIFYLSIKFKKRNISQEKTFLNKLINYINNADNI